MAPKTEVEYDGNSSPVPITGIKVEDGVPIPVRKELRKLNKDEWNLYLLGLERFKQVDEKAPLSFFQIAGIHGLPHGRWPDASWNPMDKQGPGGFCTHSSILFLPWHRPYLALFEAELSKHVRKVAEELAGELPKDQGDRLTKTAKDFRIPYWDWALPPREGLGLFPEEAKRSTEYNLTRPKATDKRNAGKESNPLAFYKFGEISGNIKAINQESETTFRYQLYDNPTVEEKRTLPDQMNDFGTSDTDFDWVWDPRSRRVVADKTKAYEKGWNLTERTVYILKAYKEFAPMSHNKYYTTQPNLLNFGSLEDSHNSIHGYSGGHMSNPETAAFDPIFWCHHTNIDRLFAIWQALNDDPAKPSTYVTEKPKGGINFINTKLRNEGPETPLAPFTKTANKPNGPDDISNFWKSQDVRYTKKFGYMYPETVEEDPAATWDALDKLYPSGSAIALLNKPKPALKASTAELAPAATSHMLIAQDNPVDTKTVVAAVKENDAEAQQTIASELAQIQLPKRSLEDLVQSRKYLEWLVNVKAVKHSLSGDYFVHFFIGDPDDSQPDLYLSNPTHVASFNTFGQSADTGCEKCQQDQAAGTEVTGQIPLTIALLERYLAGHVDGLAREAVVPFLREHLHWRVTNLDGTPVRRRDVDGLRVGVVSNEVELPADPASAEWPRYSPEVVPWPDITTNRNNGPRGDGTGYTGGALS